MDINEARSWLIHQRFSEDLPRNSEIASMFNWLISEHDRLTELNALYVQQNSDNADDNVVLRNQNRAQWEEVQRLTTAPRRPIRRTEAGEGGECADEEGATGSR